MAAAASTASVTAAAAVAATAAAATSADEDTAGTAPAAAAATAAAAAAAQSSAGAAAAAAASSSATADPLSLDTIFDKRTHDALSDDARSRVLLACDGVRIAARRYAAATLRLCIALEHATQVALHELHPNGSVFQRSKVVASLRRWCVLLDPVHKYETIMSNSQRLRTLLATEQDRNWWDTHAYLVKALAPLFLLSSYMDYIVAAERCKYDYFEVLLHESPPLSASELKTRLIGKFGDRLQDSEHSKRGQSLTRTYTHARIAQARY